MNLFCILLIAAQLLPTTAWFSTRPIRMKSPPIMKNLLLDDGIHVEDIGLAVEYTKECAEIELSFGHWLNGEVFVEIVDRMNWTLTDDEKKDLSEAKVNHVHTVTGIISEHLDVLPLRKRDSRVRSLPSFIAGEIYHRSLIAFIANKLDHIVDWELVEKDRERINEILEGLERMEKYEWTEAISQRLEDTLTTTFREIFQNGRLSQELLNSLDKTFKELVENFEQTLLKKYFAAAASVVTAHPVGRTENTMLLQVCYPNALRESTLYQLTPLGAFDEDVFTKPIVPRYAIIDEKRGESIPIWDINECKPLGPVRLCKRFEDELQLVSCSLRKAERIEGCPHISEDARDEEFVHVTSTMTGYMVATRVKEIIMVKDKRVMPERSPINQNVVFVTVPLDSTLKIGRTILKPRFATVDVPFMLEQFPSLEPSGHIPKAKARAFIHENERWIMDCLIAILIMLIVYLICHYRSGREREIRRMVQHNKDISDAMEEMNENN